MWLVLGLAISFATSVNAYVLRDYTWPSATTTFNVDMPGADGLWNQAFENAMARWNAATIFEFMTRSDTFESPCDGLPTRTTGGDSENGVAFVSDVCGEAFGENTLAVESSWSQGTRTTQSNIHFNDTYSWNVYDGPYQTGSRTGIVDFRRVAVHELGHALGLNHEDDVPAIMVTSISRGDTIVAPQADDIAGVDALYGTGTSRAPRTPVLTSPSNHARDVSLTPTLSWRRATNADSYDVYFGTSSNPSFARNTTGTSYRPSRLAPNTTYYWSIRAKNSDGTARSPTSRFTTVTPAPQNDHFSMATRVSGRSGRARGSNVGATMESGESGLGDKSVWWRWQAPISGRLTVDTTGSNFDTILGVYTGARISSLRSLAENDDTNGQQSRVMLDVTAGTTYQFRIASYDGGTGTILLNWNLQEPPQITFDYVSDETAKRFHVFPVLVDGGGWQSVLILTNVAQSASFCRLDLHGLSLDRFSEVSGITASGSTATFSLEGNGDYLTWPTRNELALALGYATLDCTASVVGQVLYASVGQSGGITGLATVFSSQAGGVFQFTVLTADASIGIAIANDTNTRTSCDVVLEDTDRVNLGDATISIPPKSNVARFLSEIIQIPPGFSSGSATVSCDQQVSIIGLQFAGAIFTTLPPTVLSTTPVDVETLTPEPPRISGGQLTPGQSAGFRLGPIDSPTLFSGDLSFRLEVPGNASRVIFTLESVDPDVDVDLYVRYEEDNAIEDGSVVTDYSSRGLTGNERIVITPSSDPPLRAGTYFVSLGLFDTGVVAQGTLIATVELGGAALPPTDTGDPWSQPNIERFRGTWRFTYTKNGAAITETFVLNILIEDDDAPGEWAIGGIQDDGEGAVVFYSRDSDSYVLAKGAADDEADDLEGLYSFNLTSPTTVSGCYFEQLSSSSFSSCYPMTGVRTSLSTSALSRATSTLSYTTAAQAELAEIGAAENFGNDMQIEVNPMIIRALEDLRAYFAAHPEH